MADQALALKVARMATQLERLLGLVENLADEIHAIAAAMEQPAAKKAVKKAIKVKK